MQSLTGCVRPGEMACLMGSSGAGKSTLLDVLAGRKTQGLIEGEIFLNGRPKEDGLWRRLSAYVEQNDVHTFTVRQILDLSFDDRNRARPQSGCVWLLQATVLESLVFSARLRLPDSVSDADLSR